MRTNMTPTSQSIIFNSWRLVLGCFLCGTGLLVSAYAGNEFVADSIEDDFDFDENDKLASHYIVFPADRPDCPTYKHNPGTNYKASQVDGDALDTIFPHYGTGESYLGRDEEVEIELEEDEEDDRCLAACLEIGTDISVAGHTMPHYHYHGLMEGTAAERQADFKHWFHTKCVKMEVCFINYAVERPLGIFWVNPNGTRQKQFDLDYSEQRTRCFTSYVGHQFEAVDDESGFYQLVTVKHITTMAFGESPPSSAQKFDGKDEVEENVKTALAMEWRKHNRVKRTFSSLGFAKGRLPDDVFANMAAFYYNNRNNVVNEEWEGKGVFVNWWDTDIKFVAIPWSVKVYWQLRLMELVSEWSGVPVEQTSMYGLRQYQTGARLLSHVDRLPTHAVSLIVNIAQKNLANPWPVEVFDHADRLHEVDMVPGDIVYYESAKNLHSRNRPLTCKKGGCSFVNLFTHYRPVKDGSDWYENMSDMPNRPKALVEGDVTFDQEPSACKRHDSNETVDNLLGIGKVQCEDRRLGEYLSPTLYKLREPGDLFRYWKATENPNFVGFDENNVAIYKESVHVEDDDEEEDDDDDDEEYEYDDDDEDNNRQMGKDEL